MADLGIREMHREWIHPQLDKNVMKHFLQSLMIMYLTKKYKHRFQSSTDEILHEISIRLKFIIHCLPKISAKLF